MTADCVGNPLQINRIKLTRFLEYLLWCPVLERIILSTIYQKTLSRSGDFRRGLMQRFFFGRIFRRLCCLFMVQMVLLFALLSPMSIGFIAAVPGEEVSIVTLDVCHAGSSSFMVQADLPMMCEFFPDSFVSRSLTHEPAAYAWLSPQHITASIEHPPQV